MPCSATEHTDGVPLCPNPKTARLGVEAPRISVPGPDATSMQLEASEETRRPDRDRGEAKMGMDYLFMARATDPQHAKAVLNYLDFQSGAVFSAMVVKGGDPYALAVALEAIKFTGRTRLIIMSDQENAVKNIVYRRDRVPVQEESSEQTTRSRNRSEH